MTRKHFIAIADTFGLHIRHADTSAERHAIRMVASALTSDFKRANTNFDADRFMDHIDAIADGSKGVTS